MLEGFTPWPKDLAERREPTRLFRPTAGPKSGTPSNGTSKSRIKRLRGTREAVAVLAIVTKAEAARWLGEHGAPSAPGGTG